MPDNDIIVQKRKVNLQHPVHQLIKKRWSPRAFSDKPISQNKIDRLFEAARWAASSYNEQPWRFIYATSEDEEAYNQILHCLKEGNQKWAKTAPLLGLAIVKKAFSKSDKLNRHAMHDLGLAMGNLTVQATEDSLFVHQMAGILVDKILEEYGISEEYEVGHGFAIGYLGEVEQLPEDLQESELKPQKRKPLNEIVFRGEWKE